MMRVFVILGEPKGKGRPRFSTVNGYVKTRTPEDTVNYENLVKLSYQKEFNGCPMYEQHEPLVMEIDAYYSIPKSTSKKKLEQMTQGKIRPTKKPDIDNMCKIIMDSLNKIAYYDDSQIVQATVNKYYSKTPRVHVRMYTLEEWEAREV
jgi:Holliday junction resolvase RusA-like endonuclease